MLGVEVTHSRRGSRGDPHEVIIDDVRQVVGGHAVRLHNTWSSTWPFSNDTSPRSLSFHHRHAVTGTAT